MGGFGWYLDKNHKHHHHSMSFTYFSIGVTSLFFVNYFSSTSVFLAILSFLLGSLSFVYSVYHIKEQIKKDRLKKKKPNNHYLNLLAKIPRTTEIEYGIRTQIYQ